MNALVGLGFIGAAIWLKRSGRRTLGALPLGSQYCDELDEYILRVNDLQLLNEKSGGGWQWGPSFDADWTPEAEEEIRATASQYSPSECVQLRNASWEVDLRWSMLKATPVDVPVDGCFSHVIHRKLTTNEVNEIRGKHRDLQKIVKLVCP